jgi:ankyrin repeat protein
MIFIGITPLGHAVGAGMVDSVRYLLDHGANPDKTGKEGCTPLQLAVAEGPFMHILIYLFYLLFCICAFH